MHPLYNTWKICYQPDTQDYNSFKEIMKVSTIEDFWSVFNHMKSPDQFSEFTALYFFLSHVGTGWEDSTNFGRIKGPPMKEKDPIQKVFMHLCMMAIGEQFTHEGAITGIVLGKKKKKLGRIDIWISEKGNNETTAYFNNKERRWKVHLQSFQWQQTATL